MSFILDALKKLEQNRKNHSVPDILTVHDASFTNERRHPLWPYLISLALFLNIAVLLIWLVPRESERINTVQSESVALKSKNNDTENQISSSLPSLSEGIITSPKTNVDSIKPADETRLPGKPDTMTTDSAVSNKINKSADELKQGKDEGAELPLKGVKEEKHRPPDNIIVSDELNPSDHEIEMLKKRIRVERASVSALVQKETAQTERAVSGSSIPELSQLSPEVKKNIPQIKIRAHIYSNNPDSRIVNINGSIIREGGTVTADLKVEEITSSGVIFNFNGNRFRMRVF